MARPDVYFFHDGLKIRFYFNADGVFRNPADVYCVMSFIKAYLAKCGSLFVQEERLSARVMRRKVNLQPFAPVLHFLFYCDNMISHSNSMQATARSGFE